MKVLVDQTCPQGHERMDVWVERGGAMPRCECGAQATRLWRSAPGIAPNGRRPDLGATVPTLGRVDTKAIAAETMLEIDQKMLRYSDPVVAEENIKREVDAHIDAPIPTPAPITATSALWGS